MGGETGSSTKGTKHTKGRRWPWDLVNFVAFVDGTFEEVEADPGAHGNFFPGSAFLSHDEDSDGYLIFTEKLVEVTAGFSNVTGDSLLSRRNPVFGVGFDTLRVRVDGS